MTNTQHTADELRKDADELDASGIFPETASMLRAGADAMDAYDKMATRFGESLETIKCLEARITAQADEINALKDQLAHEKSVVDAYKSAREHEVKRGQGYADQLTAIKGRLTEDYYIVRAISDELIGLVKTTALAEQLNDCATKAAKAIIAHVLGEKP